MENSKLSGKRCILLIRTSNDELVEASKLQQDNLLRQYAANNHMIVVDVMEADGVSGSQPGKRADLDDLRERKIQKDDYDVILVQDRSRFTRGGQRHANWLQFEFGRLGVEIVATTVPYSVDDRYSWVIEGMHDDASHAYVRDASRVQCRGRQQKIEDDILTTCNFPPFGIDRLYLNADDKPMFIVRNLPDGRQQRLHHETGEVLETLPKNVKGSTSRHFRKHVTDKVRLVPGALEAVEAVRFMFWHSYVLGWGHWRIATALNEKGILSARGGVWIDGNVAHILKNCVYTGHALANLYATGRFFIRDRVAPKEQKYDAASMVDGKTKWKVRPPEDWIIKRYPALDSILGDDAFREQVYQLQYDFWVRCHHQMNTEPKRDRHADSPYFLKHVLRCSSTGYWLIGKNARRKIRYYHIAQSRRYEDALPRGLNKMIPALRVEDAAKSLLREALSDNSDLDQLLREAVQQEADRRQRVSGELRQIESERTRVTAQITFAIQNLGEFGAEGIAKTIEPLKVKRLALDRRYQEVSTAANAKKIDVKATVSALKANLLDVTGAIKDMPNQMLRSLFQTFTTMTVDLSKFEIDVDVFVPKAVLNDPNRLKAIVGSVRTRSHKCTNKANNENALIVAKYRCTVHAGSKFRPDQPHLFSSCNCRRVKPGDMGNSETQAA